MYRKKMLWTAVSVFAFTVAANAAVHISGKIIEESTGNPLEYVNIVLLSLPDSAFAAGTVSGADGLFLLDKVNSGKYLLKISYVGLENRTVTVDVSASPVDLGNILMKESNTLKEVVVTSKTPPFQSGANGGIVANVSATLLSSAGTANDVLQRMPGVTVDNGKVTVFGKGAPAVYINNRKVRDMSELERLESSEISTVELITNPGARYDAETRAVLLIKTKARTNGFSSQATERLRQGKYLGDNENISISYTHNKLNLFATYFHSYSEQETTEDHRFILKNDDGEWEHKPSLFDNYSNSAQQVSTGLDYSLNSKHAIGGQYQFYNGLDNVVMPIGAETHLNGVLHETSQSLANMNNNGRRHSVNAFYNGDLSDRFSLRFDFDYLKNHDNRAQHSSETVNNAETREVEIFNQTDHDLYAGKLTGSYKSGVGQIEFGGEYNNIAGAGFVRSNGYTDNSEFTNMERKAAGFAGYSHKLAGISAVAGVRYEFTSEHYTEGDGKTPIIDRAYSDFYPSISISGKVKGVDLSLAFNKRTQRPSFTQLNGNVIYVNRFVFQKGDPYLNKANVYDLNMQAIAKPFYLNLGYTHVRNLIFGYLKTQENGANTILSTYANFPKKETLYATLNFNHKIAFWQPNYTAGAEQPFFTAMYDGRETEYNKACWFFSAYNDFTLPLGFTLSCNFRYHSDEQDSYYEAKSWQRLDAGLRKSFFNNNLRLNLTVYDIFNWVKNSAHLQIDNLRWNIDRKFETRFATLSISYVFNNYRKKYRGGSAAGDDVNRF